VTDLATLTRIVSELTAKVEALSARTPVRVGNSQPSALVIDVVQTGHGFTVGKAVTIASGAWALFTDYGPAYGAARPLWGIVCGVTGPNSFRLTIGGEGITTTSSLGAGYYYTFNNGDPVQIVGDYPPFDGAGAGVAVMAMSQTSVVVSNDGRFDGLQSHGGTFAVVSSPDIDAGHYVVYSGVPSGQSPLALADEANAWKWTNVGIALFEVGVAGTWLVLVAGTHAWYSYANGDARPAWMVTPAYNVGQRIYLSTTNPGQYATAEPSFKVYAGISEAGYTPASPPNPETTSFYATAVGQGVPYPIPASGGGTGTDVSGLNEHSVLFMDTYGSPSSRKIAGLLSVTSEYAVIAQKGGNTPTHLTLDLVANGSFVELSGTLYAAAGGKRFSTTAPTDKQFMRYNGTTWQPYGPLLTAVGQMLSWGSSDLVTVDCSLSNSVVGRSANSAGAFAPIQAGGPNRIFAMGATALSFTDTPLLTRGRVDFSLCTVATITASTSAPSASGVKGQMHFIY
jgi:hypothetical protein